MLCQSSLFKNVVMQLKRQSLEALQNEKHYSKGNNTSENPIPRKEIFKPADHVKYEGQLRSQHLLFVQFSIVCSLVLAEFRHNRIL